MKTEAFRILLLLLEGQQHGYAIMQELANRSNGEIRLLPGALYRHLHRLLEHGYIKEVHPGDVVAGSDRRRCYEVTDRGRREARAEAVRLAELVRQAEAVDLLAERGS